MDYIDQPCERCGSKRRIEKTWKQLHETYAGSTEVEISKVICTNPECQERFEQVIAKAAQKRQDLAEQKEKQEIVRKENRIKSMQQKQK
jgi:hypothetical protein